MFSVTITDTNELSSTTITVDKSELLIGRITGNDIILPKTNVSKRHARVISKNGKMILIDLLSTKGTFVNHQKLTGPQIITDMDQIGIGDFTLVIKEI